MKLFMIIGKSLSGKDTFLNQVLDDREFCKNNNLERLIYYTDRKMRPGEIDGKDYFFIDSDAFHDGYENKENVIYTEFDSKYGKLHYFVDLSKLNQDKNYIFVGSVEMLEQMKQKFKDLFVIYLVPPNYTLFERFTKRLESSEYDKDRYKEFYRRFVDDLYKYGIHSNDYLSGVPSIVNLGETVYIDRIKGKIKQFIESKNGAYNRICLRSVIYNEGFFVVYFNYNYKPVYYDKDFKSVLNGEIKICNGLFTLNSETGDIFKDNIKLINDYILY